jgi:hypothetical protein
MKHTIHFTVSQGKKHVKLKRNALQASSALLWTLVAVVLCLPGPVSASTSFVYDDFDDGSLDGARWTYGADPATSVNETNGRLELSITPSAHGSLFYADIWSKLTLTSDFDVSVSFDMISWPTSNGVRSALSVHTDQGALWVQRSADSPGDAFPECYAMNNVLSGIRGITATNDLSGVMRLRRQDDSFTGYYLDQFSTWQPIATYSLAEAGLGNGPVGFGMSIWSHDGIFNPGGQPAVVSFDNVTVAVPAPGAILLLVSGLCWLPMVASRGSREGKHTLESQAGKAKRLLMI